MTDHFETRLEALFDTPPAMEGNLGFALRVQQRLASKRRLRGDLTAGAWVVAGGGVLWGIISALDAPVATGAIAQFNMTLAATQGIAGVWLIPCLAVALVFGVQALEEGWARD